MEGAEMASAIIEIVRDPRRCAGEPIVAGTRTTVHDIVSYARLYDGDVERIHSEALPYLSLEQISGALAWYRDHAEKIDEILRRRREEHERARKAARVSM
jgi:uncharacterized protein (DUF433 family)